MIEKAVTCLQSSFCPSEIMEYNSFPPCQIYVVFHDSHRLRTKNQINSSGWILCFFEAFLLSWGFDINHHFTVFLLSSPCLPLPLLNFAESSFSFFLPLFLQHSVHPTLTGLSSFHLSYVFTVGICPLLHIKSFGAPKPVLAVWI